MRILISYYFTNKKNKILEYNQWHSRSWSYTYDELLKIVNFIKAKYEFSNAISNLNKKYFSRNSSIWKVFYNLNDLSIGIRIKEVPYHPIYSSGYIKIVCDNMSQNEIEKIIINKLTEEMKSICSYVNKYDGIDNHTRIIVISKHEGDTKWLE